MYLFADLRHSRGTLLMIHLNTHIYVALCGASFANGKKICSPAIEALSGEDYSTLVAALTAGLAPVGEIELPDKAVVIAPNNVAFETALKGLNLTAADILGDTDLLTKVLNYHVATVGDDGTITNLNETPINFMVDGEEASLADAIAAKAVTIENGGATTVDASDSLSCLGGDQTYFLSNGVVLPKADEEEPTPGGEMAKEKIEEAASSAVTTLAAGAMGVVAAGLLL